MLQDGTRRGFRLIRFVELAIPQFPFAYLGRSHGECQARAEWQPNRFFTESSGGHALKVEGGVERVHRRLRAIAENDGDTAII